VLRSTLWRTFGITIERVVRALLLIASICSVRLALILVD
jgi:hypothetical protein